MKSNQINFFTLPADLQSFEEIFLKNGALFIKQPIYDLNDIYINTLQYSRDEKHFDKIYLTTKEFRKNIVIEKVEKQQYHLVNILLSEVVEFSRGGFLYSSNRLERGRFYYIYSYFENNITIEKSSDFKKWANRIFSAVKKDVLIRNKSKSFLYLSKNVENWIDASNSIIHESGLHINTPILPSEPSH